MVGRGGGLLRCGARWLRPPTAAPCGVLGTERALGCLALLGADLTAGEALGVRLMPAGGGRLPPVDFFCFLAGWLNGVS